MKIVTRGVFSRVLTSILALIFTGGDWGKSSSSLKIRLKFVTLEFSRMLIIIPASILTGGGFGGNNLAILKSFENRYSVVFGNAGIDINWKERKDEKKL